MNKIFVTLLKFAISFAILGWLSYQTWRADQFDVLWTGEKRYGWLLVSLAAGIVACLVAFYRWYLLVRALDLRFSYYNAVRLGFLGSLLNLLSVGVLGGDAVKAVFLVRQMPGRAPEAVASVIFDRAIGLLVMFGFAGVAWLVADFPASESLHEAEHIAMRFVCRFSLAMAILGSISLAVLFLTPRFTKSALYRRISLWPRVGGLFKRLTGVALVYRNRFGSVLVALVLSVAVNFLYATAFFAMAAGISRSHPDFGQHLVISPIAMVANAVPLPGGLGGMEAAVNYLYRAFSSHGTPSEHGFVVALGFRIVLFVAAGIGLVFYLTSKNELRATPKGEVKLP